MTGLAWASWLGEGVGEKPRAQDQVRAGHTRESPCPGLGGIAGWRGWEGAPTATVVFSVEKQLEKAGALEGSQVLRADCPEAGNCLGGWGGWLMLLHLSVGVQCLTVKSLYLTSFHPGFEKLTLQLHQKMDCDLYLTSTKG